MANRLEGKVAAVTGGDQGIGRAIVERLAAEGADVALCYRSNKAGADEVAASVRKTGRKAAAVQCDVGKVAEGQRFVDEAVRQLGHIDILVNNAGLERRADFWDVTEPDYDAVLDVNLKGPFFLTQAFVKHRMQAKAGGKVINISSVHEELPFPHFASYCASKGGIKMLTRNLSIELAPLGITINSIAPGAIETAIKQETAERSSETEIAAGKHSDKAPRQTGRCGIGCRVSGIFRCRLCDGDDLFRRRWLDMEPRGAVRSVLENAI